MYEIELLPTTIFTHLYYFKAGKEELVPRGAIGSVLSLKACNKNNTNVEWSQIINTCWKLHVHFNISVSPSLMLKLHKLGLGTRLSFDRLANHYWTHDRLGNERPNPAVESHGNWLVYFFTILPANTQYFLLIYGWL